MFEIIADAPELEAILKDATRELISVIAADAPIEMAGLMHSGGVSSRGEPPRRQSGFLAGSLKGVAISDAEAEIDMAYYAEYLDPELGGHLDRPFIETALNKVLQNV